MMRPFDEVSRKAESIRRLTILHWAFYTSPWPALVAIAGLALLLVGTVSSLTGGGSGFLVAGGTTLLLYLLFLVAGPALRVAEAVAVDRVSRIPSEAEGVKAGEQVRSVAMSDFVAAHAVHAAALGMAVGDFGRVSSSERLVPARVDAFDEALAKRMVLAAKENKSGQALVEMLVRLHNRTQVMADPTVTVGEMLDALEKVEHDRRGLIEGLSYMLSSEAWLSVFGTPKRYVASELVEALNSMSAMDDHQLELMRSLLRGGWSGTVKEVIEVCGLVAR